MITGRFLINSKSKMYGYSLGMCVFGADWKPKMAVFANYSLKYEYAKY